MTSMPIAPLAGLQSPLYENVRAFDAADGNTRIFAPISYALVRHAQIVPIVHIEALNLAHWFPVCWQIKDGNPMLVVLRTLRNDGSDQPSGSPNSTASLPLALRAYPFVVGAGDEDDDTHFLEAAVPDQPSDVGAPIMTPAGNAGTGARQKLQAKAAFDHALPLSQAMTEDLVRQGLLERWPLEFKIGDDTVTVNDLFVVNPGEFSSPRIFQFIESFGPAAAAFLGAHRISLFRAGVLVQAAKSGAASQLQPATP
jgi:hypothetical protein